ncbi:uncharacterized protein LOC143017426 [Oratosquilla oratoria]|uniref:uncharacterized protein LOC143017426 n=1 Tax=Oratosquilla oratoria TaxID=337810 RepID=UPI003F772A3A
MASGSNYCPDCGLYFESARSLEVHLQYHKENLMSMWMGAEDQHQQQQHQQRPRDSNPSASSTNTPSGSQASELATTPLVSSSSSVSDPGSMNSSLPSNSTSGGGSSTSSTFTAPSPMQYDFKMSPSLQSPPGGALAVPPGPPSGPGASLNPGGSIGFPQQSPGGYYHDFGQLQVGLSHHLQQPQQPQQPQPPQQQAFGGYSGGFMNGTYEDQFFNRTPAPNPATPRFHPYMGRSPVPTPSPGSGSGSGMVEIKEENPPTSETPEILDLDSQRVLGQTPAGASSLQQAGSSIPPMWRPHEQFAAPSSSMLHTPQALGPALHQPSFGSSQGAPPSSATHLPGMGPGPVGFPASGPGSLTGYNPQGFAAPSMSSPSGMFGAQVAPAPSPRDPGNSAADLAASNAKRPKSFKCEDCNKWFTSHGHLKRHYNTTLHKNMTKLNGTASATGAAPGAPPGTPTTPGLAPVVRQQSSTPDPTRPPILSPGAKSIGEASTTSSQDEESNLSSSDAMEQPTTPSYQPPPVSGYQPTASGYQSPTTVSLGPSSGPPLMSGGHPGMPPSQFSQHPQFLSDQPPTAPTLYHGHFSTNPSTGYGPQPPTSGGPFYVTSNNGVTTSSYGTYQPQGQPGLQSQGGLQGPGFRSLNDFPGHPLHQINPQSDASASHHAFSPFSLDSDRPGSRGLGGPEGPNTSPDPAGDSASEASMDSSESSGAGGTSIGGGGSDGSYRCHDCGKNFNRMCYLTQHRSTYHEGEKPFKCGTCGKRFPDEVSFSDHQNKHAGEKPYKCEVCPKQFNHKTDLRRHMCLHTGEKPFTCQQCGKGFIRKDHMLKHFQTHRKKAMAEAATAAGHPPPGGPPMGHPGPPPGFPGHPGHPGVAHAPMGHPAHGPPGHPGHPQHVVAAPVY